MARLPGDGSGLLAAYAWAESADPLLEAIAITLATPGDGSVRDVLAPRLEFAGRLTVAEALQATLGIEDFAWGSVVAQIDHLPGWDVIIEPNGWAASMPETLARLSARGTAVSVFWNVNAVIAFSLARDGSIVRSFDGLLYNDPGVPLPEEAGLPWGIEAPRASVLAVMERLTGVQIEREWLLRTTRLTWVVPL